MVFMSTILIINVSWYLLVYQHRDFPLKLVLSIMNEAVLLCLAFPVQIYTIPLMRFLYFDFNNERKLAGRMLAEQDLEDT